MIARTKAKQSAFRTSQGMYLAAGGCLLIAAIFISSYFGTWHSWHPYSSSDLELQVDTTDFVQTQIGTLVLRGPGDACRAYKYDNLTSETLPASGPCEITAQIDRRIMGEPAGASRQLESVSRYFTQH
ncbi:MAG TPA: hypothetical protein VMA30_01005 [Xanthobacteraceae bacterium]|nr:hypothetical protein [Xanthobacteraceae bacterium]